ncbi:hypothetical protein HNQ60_000821 [Povalibacter uvarum]|uniref:Calx-beta domain-containing protein n=1 Tax=Povalibacter uvarum TaxID=732238 RepID=A0A841HIV0_9GAMM|nr:Calx-beta domain-containing protein [Povalibacter uvarum]MBB6091975.1 hypothetical protein [Povalibacter uvarum]
MKYTSIHTSIKWLAVATLSVLLSGCGDEGETTESTGVDTSTGTGNGGGGSTPRNPGQLQFSAPSVSINENAGNATITITRTAGSDGAVSVTVSSTNGTATSPADYAAVNSTVNFAAGDSAAKTVTVAIVNDTTDEPDETLQLTLSSPTNSAVLGSTSQVLVTIVDDDLSPPAAPRATLSSEYKTLRADWTSVTGATSYRIMKDATGGGTFAQVGADLPASAKTANIDIVVSLEDWADAGYAIAACNAAGCTQSATMTLAGLSVPLIGYLKAPEQRDYASFGVAVALSADGNTLAVGMPYNGATATPYSGIVLVYTRTGTTWSVPVTLTASNAQDYDEFGGSVSISADGNTLVVGAAFEDSGTGNEADNSVVSSGAGYVFARNGTSWTQTAYLKSAAPAISDRFGSAVAISPDGAAVAVGLPYYSISGTTSYSGQAQVFTLASGSWSRVATVASPTPSDFAYFGTTLALSNQGTTLVVGASGQDVGMEVDIGAVYRYTRSGGSWAYSDTITADTPVQYASFGSSVSISHDGATLAVGAPNQTVPGANPGDPVQQTGAVFLFNLAAGAPALLTTVVGTDVGEFNSFGQVVALSGDGSTLLVSAPYDDSGTAGLGTVRDTAQSGSGAAYLFTGSGNAWTQRNYIKASNPELGDQFAYDLAINSNGSSLAIGAPDEESGATGLNGNQLDDCNGAGSNCSQGSGAVYIY